MKRKIYYTLGKGDKTYFWLDPWLGQESLWSRIENADNIIHRSAKMATVEDYIQGGNWITCPMFDNPGIRNIWTDLHQLDWRPSQREDKVLWMSTSGTKTELSAKVAWDSCRNRGPKVCWAKTIWFSTNIPRHSFVAWRACLGALPTADQMQIRNITIPSNCKLCDNGLDNQKHMFFECEFSSSIWSYCMNRCIPSLRRTASCDTEASRLENMNDKGSAISTIPKLMFNAIIYHIWKERNSRSFGGKFKTKEEVGSEIKKAIEDKVSTIKF